MFNCSNCRLSGDTEMKFSHICQHYCGKDEATHLWTQFNPNRGSRTEMDVQNFVRHLWSKWTSSYCQGTLTVRGGQDTSESSVLTDSCTANCTSLRKEVIFQLNGLLFSKLGSTWREEQDCWTNTLLAYALTRGSDGDRSSVDSSLLTPQTCITVLKIKINHPKLSVVLINYQFSLQSVSWGCDWVWSISLEGIVCLFLM